jgi:hypothetical protein
MKHYAFTVVERLADTENDTDIVGSIEDNEDIVSKLKALLLDWYPSCRWEEPWGYNAENEKETKVETPHGSLCWLDMVEELTPEEFELYSRRVTNMTYKLKSY